VTSYLEAPRPYREGSGTAACTMALDPLGELQCTTCHVALDPTSLRGGLWAPTMHALPCGPWASSTKKSLLGLPVWQGSPVPNTHTHTFSRCLMSEPSWPCTTCGHAPLLVPMRCADRRLQCGYSAAPVLLTTHLAPLQCKVTRQHGATLLTEGGMTGGQDKVCPTPLKTSFATSS
jgi:hypothetical protein